MLHRKLHGDLEDDKLLRGMDGDMFRVYRLRLKSGKDLTMKKDDIYLPRLPPIPLAAQAPNTIAESRS
jgi:hypothetical protein